MRILGVNFGHSSAAVLIENGRILSAVDEEKLSRVKGENAFPKKSIAFILNAHHLVPRDIDIVAVGCEDLAEFAYGYRNLNKYFGRNGLPGKTKGLFYDGLKRLFPLKISLAAYLHQLFYDNLESMGFARYKIHLVNHHDAHAASAYYTCPWDNAAIVTNDGKGDGLCGAFYSGQGGIITCRDRIEDVHSIGQFYQSVTKFLGFRINRHEGKITGLAAFGDSRETFPLMNEIFQFEGGILRNTFYDNGEFTKNPLRYFKNKIAQNGFIHINYVKSLERGLMDFAVAYQLYLNFLKEKLGHYDPKEIAAGIQRLAEEVITSYVREKLQKFPAQKICLAGGVFANVKINQRVREIAGVEDVYIQPAMDDAGTALGAALHVWMGMSKSKSWVPMKTVYLGPEFTEGQIEESLRKYQLSYRRVENYSEVLGKYIFEGKVIGRFNGALEWGPRALGNRSILAHPINKNINDILNQRLKRTEFMPFAPSILSDDAENYLKNFSPHQLSARHMTITYNVKSEAIDRIQAAVHVDGTARPQVVFAEDNPSFYKIIQEYKKRSGIGVVINTSFNMHEEPIVGSPNDAIRSFLAGAVDILSLGPFIVESKRN